jgi:hypothetical protein
VLDACADQFLSSAMRSLACRNRGNPKLACEFEEAQAVDVPEFQNLPARARKRVKRFASQRSVKARQCTLLRTSVSCSEVFGGICSNKTTPPLLPELVSPEIPNRCQEIGLDVRHVLDISGASQYVEDCRLCQVFSLGIAPHESPGNAERGLAVESY